MALEEEGSKASETISSLDTASRTPTSPSFVGRSSVQSESQTSGPQEEECTVVLSDTEQPVTGMENRNAPDALIPVPIVSLNEGNSGATQSVPEVNTAIIHIASEIDEASSSPYSKDVPLNEANDAQSLEGQARSSLPHYQTAQTDTGQLDTPPPLEVSVVEVAPSEEDAAAVPREPPMTVTRETKVNLAITLDILTIPTPSFDPRDPADALSVEELENDGQPPGKPPNSEAELTPVQAEPEANVFGQPTQPSSSSTNQLQAEFSSSSPSLSSETSTIPLHDATPVPQPVVHQDLPQHSAPSTFVSAIDSSMTLNTSSNLLGPYLCLPWHPPSYHILMPTHKESHMPQPLPSSGSNPSPILLNVRSQRLLLPFPRHLATRCHMFHPSWMRSQPSPDIFHRYLYQLELTPFVVTDLQLTVAA